LVPFLVGLFAMSEVLIGAERAARKVDFSTESLSVKLPGLKTLGKMKDVILRSSLIGTIIGIIPGEGAAVGAFFAYSEAKRRSKNPDAYGTGIPEGIVAPETANNATVGGALVPTLTLGVPGSPAAAVLLGALLIQGLTPGPKLFSDEPDLMYAIFIGLFLINILMMFIGLIAIRFAAQLIRVPTSVIVPTVMLLSFVGIYSVSNSFFNVSVLLGAGILGYVVRKLGYSIAPLSIGFVLGPILENSLRQSLTIADGSVAEFFNTPIGLTIYVALALTILWGPITKRLRG
jgi:putative tricarboxylic transport membrane protein